MMMAVAESPDWHAGNTTADSTSPVMRRPFRSPQQRPYSAASHKSNGSTGGGVGQLHQASPASRPKSASARPQVELRQPPRQFVGKAGHKPFIGMRVVMSDEARIWRLTKFGKEESQGLAGILTLAYEEGKCWIKWDNGRGNWYSIGQDGRYELVVRQRVNQVVVRPSSALPSWSANVKNTMSVRY